ncbi:MAG TPA: GNAT family N-acetyltransferase, partial [Candidatus Limnocylindrales bacterium]|nr:GNAT family N-acetyltransferase [Candidatus Limnocylindrales bacterium]
MPVAAQKPKTTEIALKHCLLREWRPTDAESLVVHANNIKVWRNLHDAFPHPYTRADAEAWIQKTSTDHADNVFAIVVDGKA